MNNAEYLEFKYPHHFPDDPLLDTVKVDMSMLTPLECAFVRWHVTVGSAEEAMERLIHPAHPFDTKVISHRALLARKTVAETLRKIKIACPYLSLYTLDYVAGLLHEEIEHVRVARRHDRFKDPSTMPNLNGKKSAHEEEFLEANYLLDCLKHMKELRETAGAINADTGDGSQGGSITRVVGAAEKLIRDTEARVSGSAPESGPE